MCWIDDGERANHGMGLGVFAWSGIAIAIERDGRWKKKCQIVCSFIVSGFVCLDTYVSPSVAGCIEIY